MTNGDIGVRVRPNRYHQNQTEFFPMDFDLPSIKHFMQQKKGQNISSEGVKTKMFNDSQQLKQYGKCRFDNVVLKSLGSDLEKRSARQRPATCPAAILRRPHSNTVRLNIKGYRKDSGPSKEGSVIYNKKALILSTIRTRPSTVQSDKRQMGNTNSHFLNLTNPVYRLKVADSTIGGSSALNQSTVNYSDIILLPLDSCSIRTFLVDKEDKKSDVEEVSVEPQRSHYRKPSIPVLVQIDAPDSSDADSDNDVTNGRFLERPSSRGSARGSPRQLANKGGEARGRKKSPSASGREGSRGKTADTLSPASASRRLSSVARGRSKGKAPGVGRDRRNNSAGRRTLMDESPTRLPLPGPHCWVDDVTVSSVVLDEEERGESPFVEISKPSLNRFARDGLPDFLCPSSELKSRNFATKMWIRESSFLKADTVIPLI